MTKTYKKTNKNTPHSITSIDKKIAQDLRLDDRIEVSASRDAFNTLKDHKPDSINNPTCRLINPTKSEIGIISKHILDNINEEKIKVTRANLWRSTSNVIKWFQAIPNKSKHAFITFDVCDFYPSITEQLLARALDCASGFTYITPQDHHIIPHTKKLPPYHQNTPGEKKNTSTLFDVTMGSYDGAKTCELVGIYMLSLITSKFKDQASLYWMMDWRYAKQCLNKSKKGNKKSARFSKQMASKSPLKQTRKP